MPKISVHTCIPFILFFISVQVPVQSGSSYHTELQTCSFNNHYLLCISLISAVSSCLLLLSVLVFLPGSQVLSRYKSSVVHNLHISTSTTRCNFTLYFFHHLIPFVDMFSSFSGTDLLAFMAMLRVIYTFLYSCIYT